MNRDKSKGERLPARATGAKRQGRGPTGAAKQLAGRAKPTAGRKPLATGSVPGRATPGGARPVLARFLFGLGAAVGLLAGALAGSYPMGEHGWRSLGPGQGTIRWVTVTRGSPVAAPLAPAWIRRLRAAGIPWPTDLPLEPLPASFGGGDGDVAAWFLIRTPGPRKELWHLDKASVELADASGRKGPWEGGTGAVRAGEDRQLLYLGLPPGLTASGPATLRLRLALFNGERTQKVTFRIR